MDLIFATSQNLIAETGAELSIFEKCHHNFIYGIIDFQVPFPSPYLREVWDYKNTYVNHIQHIWKKITTFFKRRVSIIL